MKRVTATAENLHLLHFSTRSQRSACDWHEGRDRQVTPDLQWRLNRTIMTLHIDADMISLKASNAYRIYIAINRIGQNGSYLVTSDWEIPEENHLSDWLEFLLGSAMEIWSHSSDPQWQSNYRNSDVDKTNMLVSLVSILKCLIQSYKLWWMVLGRNVLVATHFYFPFEDCLRAIDL